MRPDLTREGTFASGSSDSTGGHGIPSEARPRRGAILGARGRESTVPCPAAPPALEVGTRPGRTLPPVLTATARLVLVTGAPGFVGGHLVRELLARGDRVRCLVRRAGVPEGLAGLDVEIVAGDVTRPDTLGAAVAGADEIYHLAARLTAMRERDMLETNVRGTRHLLEAARRSDRLVRFVHCSSLAVSGPCRADGLPVEESTPAAPVTWYGRSKALAERAVRAYAEAGMPVTVVRPPVVYGPRDRGLLSVFQAVARGLRPVLGRRPKSYSWVYGPDLARALVVLGRHPATVGRTYFAGHDVPAPMEEFLDAAAAALGGRTIGVRVPESTVALLATASDLVAQATGSPGMLTRDKVNELRPAAWVCSSAAATRDTGWRATTPLRDGVGDTARWYAEHGWLGSRRGPRPTPPTDVR